MEDIDKIWKFFQNHNFTEEGIGENDFHNFVTNMYFQNPPNIHYQIVAEDENRIIGHEAIIPVGYKFYDQNLILGLGSNTLIDERNRNMLLFLQMQNFFFSNYSKYNLNFTYGLVTRQDVLKIHLKTGYKRLGDVYVYARPYKLQKIIREVFRNHLTSSILIFFAPLGNLFFRFSFNKQTSFKVKSVDSFLREWNDTIINFNSQFKISGIRNVDVLNWRFSSLKYRNYKILVALEKGALKGYAVIRPMKMRDFSSLAVVDLLTAENDTLTINALFRKIHKLALESKVDLISTILADHSTYKKYFEKSMYFKTPEFFSLVADQPKAETIKISADIFKDWHVNWFDHDFV